MFANIFDNFFKFLTMISPRSEFQETPLAVKREISDIDFAGASDTHRWGPKHRPIVVDDGACPHKPDCIIIGATKEYHLDSKRIPYHFFPVKSTVAIAYSTMQSILYYVAPLKTAFGESIAQGLSQ